MQQIRDLILSWQWVLNIKNILPLHKRYPGFGHYLLKSGSFKFATHCTKLLKAGARRDESDVAELEKVVEHTNDSPSDSTRPSQSPFNLANCSFSWYRNMNKNVVKPFLKHLLYLLYLHYNLTNEWVLDKSVECTPYPLAHMSLPMQ